MAIEIADGCLRQSLARILLAAVTTVLFGSAAGAQAQEKEPRRVRLALGPQVVPTFPGSDEVRVQPLIGVSLARGDTPFEFGASDQSFGPAQPST